MKTLRGVFLAQALLASLAVPLVSWAAGTMPDYKIAGPVKSHNLEVFIIHGSDTAKGQNIQTLAEAMKAKTFKVFETGNVNELACQNLSSLPVFIQSGDIVKGGRQDRTMQYDLLVPPNSKKMPLSSFCVESGRWQKRGSESDSLFSSSMKSLPGKELKLAAKYTADQGAVWASVSKSQGQLSKAARRITENASPTSLQMTMENGELEKSAATYTNDLKGLASKDKDAIGYAFSIDGKLNSADVYASHDLFVKLWPKLLEATAVEAVSGNSTASPNSPKPKPIGVDDVKGFLSSSESAKPALKRISAETSQETRDSAKAVYFETKTNDNSWLHKNYIMK
ncbi:MAG: hypothetical protein HYX67_08645 [Candidatus Melainabacteria bacterium]|nr:hypothetical protein [Candidatus Melainabacteria bacterium]